MLRELLMIAVISFACVVPYGNAALPELGFNASMQTLLDAAKDSRYELKKKEAGHALDLLKTVAKMADETNDRTEKLGKEMQKNQYVDLFNTKFLPLLHEAKAKKDGLKKIYDLEKGRVKKDLDKAKGGDYSSIEEDLARIDKFRTENAAAVIALQENIKAVEAAYRHDFANAQAALEQLKKSDPVPGLLTSIPKLVKKIYLEPVTLRPLQWRVVIEKEGPDYNDPRFAQVPSTITVEDGKESLAYPVVVRGPKGLFGVGFLDSGAGEVIHFSPFHGRI